MYLEHFGLAVNPFGLSPKLDFLYKSETFEESMAHLIYGLDNQEAIVLITGAIGTGKTMALQSFLTNLGPRFEFALVANTRVTPIELLKLILEDLGVKLPLGADKSDVLILFKDFLVQASNEGKMVLIVIDEAQNLSSDVLEEIRLLTNLGQGDTQPVQIILVGQPELEATMNRPDLAQMRQRIRVHYRLDPLNRFECQEYIHHRMRVGGCHRQVFSSEAIDIIFEMSKGVPRLVNTMAGEALLSAFVTGHGTVKAEDVETDRDLSFEAGPKPPAPAPVPTASAPRVIPPAAAAPPPPPPSRPKPEPTAEPRVEISRHPRRGLSGPARAGMVAAVLVLFVGALYVMGYLDGVMTRFAKPVSFVEASPRQVVSPPPVTTESTEVVQQETDDVSDIPDTEQAAPEQTAPEQTAPEQTSPKPQEVATTTATTSEPEPRVSVPAEVIVDDIVENIYIHVSSFRTPERAQSMVKRFVDKGLGAVYLEREVRGEDWYRVYLGPYGNAEDAYHDALKLKQNGTISFYRITQIDPNDGI